jgi:hypothetical protein
MDDHFLSMHEGERFYALAQKGFVCSPEKRNGKMITRPETE